MCISRLKAGEAPACVRACPNGAIRITVLDKLKVKNEPQEFVKIPDAPDPHFTLPTTRYMSRKGLPRNMTAMDFYSIKPERSHLPLIVMLVLTQLSVGTFGMSLFLKNFFDESLRLTLSNYHGLVGLGAGFLALGASIFHLGRPLYAFRAVIGFSHSWLSREIAAFAAFAFLAMIYFLSFCLEPLQRLLSPPYQETLAYLTAFLGGVGVFTSVKVYQVTHRSFWDHPLTFIKFFFTMGILGSATILMTTTGFLFIQPHRSWTTVSSAVEFCCLSLLILSAVKMFFELTIFLYLMDREWTPLKKTAIVLVRFLKKTVLKRFGYGFAGGIVLPLVMLSQKTTWGLDTLFGGALLIFVCSLTGEFLERYLFFKAVIPLKMPGANGK